MTLFNVPMTNGNDDNSNSLPNGFTGLRINAQGGDDVLRGSKGADILIGGTGSDQMFGGSGADQFRFDLTHIVGGDKDNIRDLKFAADGDKLVFTGFAVGTFTDTGLANGGDLDAVQGGAGAIVNNIDGLVDLVAQLGWTASGVNGNNNLVLTAANGYQVTLTNLASDFLGAGGVLA